MAGRLSAARGEPGRARRRGAVALAALTLAVLAVHLWLLSGARDLHDQWMPATPEPERLKAAFVRELKPAAPPPPAAAAKQEGPPGAPKRVVQTLPATVGAGPAPLPPDPAASQPPPELQALAMPPALAVSEAAGDWMPGIEWPLSTELDYKLTGDYRGPVYGDAQVQWLREGSHYQVHLEAWIGPKIAPLMSRRLSSDGEITPIGLVPRRFDEVTGGLAGGRHSTLRFDIGGVIMADGRREPAPDGTQDAASQFVQFTWLFLTGRQTVAGDTLIQQPLALPRNLHLWRYRIIALEEVATPLGPIPAWHVDSDMSDTRGDMQAEFWLAPSLQYLPVRVRLWQNRAKDPRTQIDLVLKAPPRQAMPAAPSPVAPASSAASAPL